MSDRADVFETLYRSNLDPWDYETSGYEQDKYRMTLAALPRERYRSVVEIGCSIAVLGEKLAGRADRYLGLDVSPTAVEAASERLAGLPWATVVTGEVPDDWPDGSYDLVVLSEILYFLSAPEIADLAALVARDTAPGGATTRSCFPAASGPATLPGRQPSCAATPRRRLPGTT